MCDTEQLSLANVSYFIKLKIFNKVVTSYGLTYIFGYYFTDDGDEEDVKNETRRKSSDVMQLYSSGNEFTLPYCERNFLNYQVENSSQFTFYFILLSWIYYTSLRLLLGP